jgi:ABC-2 type transport system permease protein
MGLLISTKQKNQVTAAQISLTIGFLPAYMLSGFIFEVSSMPWPIYLLTFILPAKYFVTSLQTLFLVGNVWKLIIIDTLCILLIGLFLFYRSLKSTSKFLE